MKELPESTVFKIRIYGTKPFKHPFPLISWLIRLIEWSKQSHVVIHDLDSNNVSHARFNDIRWESFDDFIKENSITESHEIKLTYDEWVALRAFISSSKGKQKGYYITLLGLLVPQILRTLSKDKILLNNFFPFGQSCSWYVHEALAFLPSGTISDTIKDQKVNPESLCTDDILLSAKKIVDLQKKQ